MVQVKTKIKSMKKKVKSAYDEFAIKTLQFPNKYEIKTDGDFMTLINKDSGIYATVEISGSITDTIGFSYYKLRKNPQFCD